MCIGLHRCNSYFCAMKYSYKYELVQKGNARGEYPLRCRVSYCGRRVDIFVGCSLAPSEWIADKQMAKGKSKDKKIIEVNAQIAKLSQSIDELFARCELIDNRMPSTEEIKTLNKKHRYTNKISELLELYLSDNNHIALTTARLFKYAVKSVVDYFGDISINEMDESFFVRYFHRLTLLWKNSTCNVLSSKIRTMLRWAAQKKLYTADGLNHKNKLKTIQKTIIYLEKDELRALYQYAIDTETMYEKHFLLAFCFCAFTGLRYSDMSKIRWTDVHDGYITVVTQKTADELHIELNAYSKQIINYYRDVTYGVSANVFVRCPLSSENRILKTVCQKLGFDTPVTFTYYNGNERITTTLPKYDCVSTHTARKTFVVNSIRLGIPLEVIMRWTGHKSLRSIAPYLKIVDEVKRIHMDKFDKIFD